MYYKCNSKFNGMLALIRFSDTLYLVVPKRFFYFAYIKAHPVISPPPLRQYAHTKPLMTLYKPRALKWDFTICYFYCYKLFKHSAVALFVRETFISYLRKVLLRVKGLSISLLTYPYLGFSIPRFFYPYLR